MNRKGFAISGLIYGILIIFLLLIFSVLGILVGRSSSLNKVKNDALNTVLDRVTVNNITSSNLVADFDVMYVNSGVVSGVGNNYLDVGIKVVDGLSVTSTTDFSFGHEGMEYNITFNAINANNEVVASVTKKIVEKNDIVKNFEYTGNRQELVVGPGIYKLEVWGAESGKNTNSNKGSYARGYLTVTTAVKLYIYVGGIGTDILPSTTARTPGGYNGGEDCFNGSTGGGATDIRINDDSIYARAITANGGDGTCGKGGSFFNMTPGFAWTSNTKKQVDELVEDWLLTEKDYLLNTIYMDGYNSFPSPGTENERGHSGNGYAKITYMVSFE